MATLRLEVDDMTLAKANEVARVTGADYREELVRHLSEFAARSASLQLEAVRRLIQSADEFPAYLEEGMPSREERNSR